MDGHINGPAVHPEVVQTGAAAVAGSGRRGGAGRTQRSHATPGVLVLVVCGGLGYLAAAGLGLPPVGQVLLVLGAIGATAAWSIAKLAAANIPAVDAAIGRQYEFPHSAAKRAAIIGALLALAAAALWLWIAGRMGPAWAVLGLGLLSAGLCLYIRWKCLRYQGWTLALVGNLATFLLGVSGNYFASATGPNPLGDLVEGWMKPVRVSLGVIEGTVVAVKADTGEIKDDVKALRLVVDDMRAEWKNAGPGSTAPRMTPELAAALAKLEKAGGHEDRARAAVTRAVSTRKPEDFAEADRRLAEWEVVRESRGPRPRPDDYAFASLSGDRLYFEDRFEEAVAHYEAALRSSPDEFRAINNLALALHLSHHTDWRAVQERAQALHERALSQSGLSQADQARSLSKLSLILQAHGRLKEAIDRKEPAVGIDEKHFGGGAPSPAMFTSNLLMIHGAHHDMDGASEQLERAIGIKEKHSDMGSFRLAASCDKLASNKNAPVRRAEAVALWGRAYAIRLKALGPNNPYTKFIDAAITRGGHPPALEPAPPRPARWPTGFW